jgi:hypothetical protein
LLTARARRPAPLRDEKILAAWNGLMIGAFARAALVLNEPSYAARAARAADFVLVKMRRAGRLLRSHSEGESRHDGYLEDYAFLIAGLLDLHEATSAPRWLSEAIALDRVLEQHFEDAGGGYFATSDTHEPLFARAKPVQDGAEPSGNSVAALNLLRLHELSDDDRYRQRAGRTLQALSKRLAQAPAAFSELLLAVDFQLDLPKQVVIVAPTRDAAEPLLGRLRRAFVPNRVLVVAVQGADLLAQARLVPLLEGKRALAGKATAYVCERRVCDRPTSEPDVFAAQLAKAQPLADGRSAGQRALAETARAQRDSRAMRHISTTAWATLALLETAERPRSASDRSLLRHPAGGDRPDGFHAIAAQAVDAVVQVHRRIAVRNQELEPLAERDVDRRVGQVEPAVLVARPQIGDARGRLQHRRERPVGRERLVAAVDDGRIGAP